MLSKADQVRPKKEKKLCLQCKHRRYLKFFTTDKEKICIDCKVKGWRAEEKKKPSNMKQKAWKAFSKYIRTRDCLLTTGTKEYGICTTCRRQYPFTELQAGHFVSGRKGAVLFHEEIVNIQCARCNKHLGGNYAEYTLVMVEKYGQAKVDEFLQLKHQIKDYTSSDYEEILNLYTQKVREL